MRASVGKDSGLRHLYLVGCSATFTNVLTYLPGNIDTELSLLAGLEAWQRRGRVRELAEAYNMCWKTLLGQ